MRLMKKISLVVVFAVFGLLLVVPATADPVQYEFETITGWVFSAEQEAIESIAGQPSAALHRRS